MTNSYADCPDFGTIYSTLHSGPSHEFSEYLIQDGFLFKGVKLYVPKTSVRDFLIWELHAGGLARYFEKNKTIATVEDHFF